MAKIEESVMVQADPQKVWEIVSDLDAEPKYWKGTKSIRNISRDDNMIRREITIAFRNKRCMQAVRLDPPHKIHYEFTEGVIQGNKTVTVTGEGASTTISVTWDTSLTGMMGMFSGSISGHIRKGTKMALDSIKREAEENVR